jgi:hypothetical protein
MAVLKISTQRLVDHVGEQVYRGPGTAFSRPLQGGLQRNGKGVDIVFWTDMKGEPREFLRVGDEIDLKVRHCVGAPGGGRKIVKQFKTFEFIGWKSKLR